MVTVSTTAKTAVSGTDFGFQSKASLSLPAADDAESTGTSFIEHTDCANTSLSGLLSLGDKVVLFMGVSNSNAGPTWEVRGSDGTTVLWTNTTSSGSEVEVTSGIITVGAAGETAAIWNNLRVFGKLSSATWVMTVHQDSIKIMFAPMTNITDLSGKYIIDKVHFFNVSGTEGLNGITSTSSASDFTTVDYKNMITNGITWSGNSGNVIYDWSGKYITGS